MRLPSYGHRAFPLATPRAAFVLPDGTCQDHIEGQAGSHRAFEFRQDVVRPADTNIRVDAHSLAPHGSRGSAATTSWRSDASKRRRACCRANIKTLKTARQEVDGRRMQGCGGDLVS